MADYWVRKLGVANKSSAIDLAHGMALETFNASTFDANDRIFFSGIDGDLTKSIIPPSESIILLADPERGCTVHGGDVIESCIDIVSKNDVIVEGIDVTHPLTDGVQVRGTSTGVVIRNIDSSYSGNQAFQMENTAAATFFNITGRNCVDDGFSMHDDAVATIHGGIFSNNGQGINIISATSLDAYDCTISGSLNPSVDVIDSNFSKTPRLNLVRAIVSGGSKNVYASGNGDVTLDCCVFNMAGTNHGIDIENTGKLFVKTCSFYNVPTGKYAIVFRVGSVCNGVYNSIFANSLGGGIYTNVNSDIANCILTGLSTGVTRVAGSATVRKSCFYGNTSNVSGTITQSANITTNPLFTSPTDYHLQPTSPCRNVGAAIAGITTDLDGNQYPSPNGASIGPYEDYPLPTEGMGSWSHFDGSVNPLALSDTSPANLLEVKVETNE